MSLHEAKHVCLFVHWFAIRKCGSLCVENGNEISITFVAPFPFMENA
jgi:hypothetical protein